LQLSCATGANHRRVRAERRRRELAVRSALGASAGSIVRLLLVESLAIGIAGAAAGVLVARASLSLLGAFLLPGGIAIGELGLDVNGTVLAVSAVLGILTSLLFGMAPVWQATRPGLASPLRDGARGATRQPLRAALVMSQVALCVMLVGGSLAFGRAIQDALAVDLGFGVAHGSMTTVNPKLVRYDIDQILNYQRQVLDEMAAAPQITSAGWAIMAPLRGRMQWTATFAGYTPPPSEDASLDANVVSPGYFSAMDMRVLAGRDFAPQDTDDAEGVMILNEAAARKYFGDRPAVGGKVTFDPNEKPVRWSTVVGVVNDVRRGPASAPLPMMYLPLAQTPEMLDFGSLRLIVRSPLPPATATREVAAILQRVDPIVPILERQTLSDHLGRVLMPQRLGLMLFALFSGMAVVLTAFGIYAVVSYAVAHRTQEIGLRMALGASRANVLRLVMRQGAVPVVAGLTIGLAGFAMASRALQQFMFSRSAADPVALAGLALVVGVVASLAMVIPAGRATRVDPTVALRSE
jgi:putative ABC transport system permease protein